MKSTRSSYAASTDHRQPDLADDGLSNAPKSGACQTSIHIANDATVNIYTCSPHAKQAEPTPSEPPQECPPGLPPTGACVPLALGSKPKKSLDAKLRPLLENAQVPSVLPAAFFQMARRFLLGRDPANALEEAAFETFQKFSPALRRILACALQTFDALSPRDRDRLFAPELTGNGDQPVDVEQLAELVANELLQRASLDVFGGGDCIFEEQPGQVRLIDVGGEIGSVLAVTICRINGLRTNDFQPPLSLGEYTPDEVQHLCTPEIVGDQVIPNCEVQTDDCPGNEVEGTCLRVPEVRAGEAVVLQGVNFFDIQTRVRLEAQAPGTTVREVETHVCGDVTTPVTETVDGVERTIADCRVQDILTFRVPEDLPDGVYGLKVIVPNNVGLPGFGEEFESNRTQFIRVIPAATATFQIAADILKAVKETAPAFFGSDEVSIKTLAVPIALDLTPGPVFERNFEFGDVDSGEDRRMGVLFQQDNIGGVALSIIGFEVDSRDIFEKQIQDFEDAYVEILESNWEAIATSVGAVGGLVALALGLSQAWATAIAAAIALAINIFVALWAPADLIIEDAAAFTTLDLGMLTSPNFPQPTIVEFTSAGGIAVRVEPVSKDFQYVERREYRSDEEDSEYHITLRYNRL